MATYEEYKQYAKVRKENLILEKQTLFTIICEACGSEKSIVADNMAEARIRYTEQGWVKFIDNNLCPECKERILNKIY